jgi:hypothetical protein
MKFISNQFIIKKNFLNDVDKIIVNPNYRDDDENISKMEIISVKKNPTITFKIIIILIILFSKKKILL